MSASLRASAPPPLPLPVSCASSSSCDPPMSSGIHRPPPCRLSSCGGRAPVHAALPPPPRSRDRHAARVARAAAILLLLRLAHEPALLLLELVHLRGRGMHAARELAASATRGCSLQCTASSASPLAHRL